MSLLYRITNKERDLQKERENRLAEWSSKRQSLRNWMKEREDKLENLGEIAQDLDTVRKQTQDLKVGVTKRSLGRIRERVALAHLTTISKNLSRFSPDTSLGAYGLRDVSGEEPPFSVINSYLIVSHGLKNTIGTSPAQTFPINGYYTAGY